MQTHVKVLGVLFLIFAACLAFLAIAIPLGMGIVGAIVSQSGDPDAGTGAAVMGLVGTFAAGMFGVIALLQGLCGWGLLQHKPWARILGIVLCALSLLKIPFGTIFGIYGLWVLLKKETEAMFSASPAS